MRMGLAKTEGMSFQRLPFCERVFGCPVPFGDGFFCPIELHQIDMASVVDVLPQSLIRSGCL